MNTEYIGPRQQAILDAMDGGAELWQRPGTNGYSRFDLDGKAANREACMALFLRGYMMIVEERGRDYRLVLTDKGRRAVKR